ncbi:hypothetical protein J4Q44_G00317980 [Coregonus suidteri]|uniref:DDE-1 domain-containing protein n=1 Tax=Coregonus suidteri TaxID=861788 RepID=A0AAN8QA46_9TELE
MSDAEEEKTFLHSVEDTDKDNLTVTETVKRLTHLRSLPMMKVTRDQIWTLRRMAGSLESPPVTDFHEEEQSGSSFVSVLILSGSLVTLFYEYLGIYGVMQLPKDYQEKLVTFRAYCKKKITEKKIRPEHITNMDEVPLTFDIPVNRTVEKTGTSTVSVRTTGNEKSSFTVVLACQANGQKLPPMIIFKRKTLPKENFPAGVVIKASPKGWMDEEKMKLQPLDIGVNRAFKARLRAAWEQWMTEGEHTFTKTGRQRRATYATICQWIVDAWADISVSTVVKAFTKAGIISELPGNSSDTDSDNDEREPGRLDAVVAQLFNSDTEEEEFEGFVDGE